jgi:hypothetical protein
LAELAEIDEEDSEIIQPTPPPELARLRFNDLFSGWLRVYHPLPPPCQGLAL